MCFNNNKFTGRIELQLVLVSRPTVTIIFDSVRVFFINKLFQFTFLIVNVVYCVVKCFYGYNNNKVKNIHLFTVTLVSYYLRTFQNYRFKILKMNTLY